MKKYLNRLFLGQVMLLNFVLSADPAAAASALKLTKIMDNIKDNFLSETGIFLQGVFAFIGVLVFFNGLRLWAAQNKGGQMGGEKSPVTQMIVGVFMVLGVWGLNSIAVSITNEEASALSDIGFDN